MTLEQIAQFVALVVIFLVQLFILSSQSYFKKKGENLATREDISKITEEIERVKHQYVVLIEELKAKHQLRLAALDKRLHAHQEAFALWRKILSVEGQTEDGFAIVTECQNWYNDNCLYLEPEARDAFMRAYLASGRLKSYRDHARPEDRLSAWNDMKDAGNTIMKAVQLPGLSEAEKKEIGDKIPTK